ncbi:peptide chain release factor N(5)-glutamine methyltransferase [Patescibacteria group bacterium]|nr:peptide chain release factor N(5)-glutamine methyltransferase [Patescibacteria group bacterium]MBU4579576.1 peptide chain release factor N(5)-glutamine methyltransferase [Patescibacteria group bacterium]
MTIKEILRKSIKILVAKKIDSANIDAEILLLHILNQSRNKPKTFRNDRSWLCAHNDYKLSKPQENKFHSLIKRREKFEPIAYITCKKEFYGLEFHIDKNVLIPRPETEILAENALKEILKDITWRLSLQVEDQPPNTNKKMIIADIGTGSGAIAITIAKTLKDKKLADQTKIYATDISLKALKIAKINAKKHNCNKNIIFKKGNLLKALPKNTKIDYLLANLPYGRKNYLYKQIKDKTKLAIFFGIKYEPKISIFAANDGMKYFDKFFPTLPKYTANGTKIFLESDPRQISSIEKLAKKYLPKHKITVIKDLRGLNRITKIEIK